MRPLNKGQAIECETASKPRCHCRCGGRFHGAARITDPDKFSDLPVDDPHHRPGLEPGQALGKMKRIIMYAKMQSTSFSDLATSAALHDELDELAVRCARVFYGAAR